MTKGRSLNLTMTFEKKSGRYLVRNVEDQPIQFPSTGEVIEIWREVFPHTSFHIGSGIEWPTLGFYVDVGVGTKSAKRKKFCVNLASAIVKQIPSQCPEATELHHRINKIITLTPDEFLNKDILVTRLINLRDSIKYRAPEIIGTHWEKVAMVLSTNLPDPDFAAEWAKEIAELFGKPVS